MNTGSTSDKMRARPWNILSHLGWYTLTNFRMKVFLYLLFRSAEFLTQLLAAASIAIILQNTISNSDDLGTSQLLQRLLGGGFSELLSNFTIPRFVIFIAVILLINVIFAYCARRILARVAIRVEDNLAADVVAILRSLKYETYQNLSRHLNMEQNTLLRMMNQNTRYTGIAARNLLSAFFTGLLLISIFAILYFINAQVMFVTLISAVLTIIALIFVFLKGMKHSLDFPRSIPAAVQERRSLLNKALSGNTRYTKNIRVEYLKNEKINYSVSHYEDRFKIIDFGELLTATITALTFALIVYFFGSNTNALGQQSVSPFVVVAVIFIGNLLLQSVKRISTLLISIGRLYDQVREILIFKNLALNSETKINPLTGQLKKGDLVFSDNVFLHNDDLKDLSQFSMFAVCQQEAVNKLGFYKFIENCVITNEKADRFINSALLADAEGFDVYWEHADSSRKQLLEEEFIGLLHTALGVKSLDKDLTGATLLESTAFQLYVYAQLHKGILLIPLSTLKVTPPQLFSAIMENAKTRMNIALGRSPAEGLRGYSDIIPFVIFQGNISASFEVNDACAMPGAELQRLLNPKYKTDTAEEGVDTEAESDLVDMSI